MVLDRVVPYAWLGTGPSPLLRGLPGGCRVRRAMPCLLFVLHDIDRMLIHLLSRSTHQRIPGRSPSRDGRTRVRRSALISGALACAAALIAPPLAAAKEGVEATLTTPIALTVQPGTELRVDWSLVAIDDAGQRKPYNANGVFVRLISAAGAPPREGFAALESGADGTYEASVTVPEGGIGDIEIGIQGTSSGAGGTRRSDLLFPITNDPLPKAVITASATPAREAPSAPADESNLWPPILIGAGLLLIAGAVAPFVVRHRKRPTGRIHPHP